MNNPNDCRFSAAPLLAASLLLITCDAVATVHYVDLNSTNATSPYTAWSTAATNIQDAVDAAVAGDGIVVTNGTYATGGRGTTNQGLLEDNRVAVIIPIRLQSVNGPQSTIIDGGHSGRCVYLTNNASLCGFTLLNGTAYFGAGAFCESANAVVSDCVVSGNSTSEGIFDGDGPYPAGGGAYGGTLNNCLLIGNLARGCWLGNCNFGFGGAAFACVLNNCTLSDNLAAGNGGGALACTLNNCTLTSNFARFEGGGASGCTLNNCILYNNCQGNAAQITANYLASTLNFCCTVPRPTDGLGNITNAPLFVDGGNGRLQSNSPCVNAGNNAYAPAVFDLDGNERIKGRTVDIGAYEFQSPVSQISYAWLQQYRLPIDPLTDAADPDADGLNNWQEWRCGTDPTNALSVLRLLAPSTTPTNVAVAWQSVGGVTYFVQRATNLTVPPAFTTLATNLLGQPGTMTYNDTTAIGPGPVFYRVGVEN